MSYLEIRHRFDAADFSQFRNVLKQDSQKINSLRLQSSVHGNYLIVVSIRFVVRHGQRSTLAIVGQRKRQKRLAVVNDRTFGGFRLLYFPFWRYDWRVFAAAAAAAATASRRHCRQNQLVIDVHVEYTNHVFGQIAEQLFAVNQIVGRIFDEFEHLFVRLSRASCYVRLGLVLAARQRTLRETIIEFFRRDGLEEKSYAIRVQVKKKSALLPVPVAPLIDRYSLELQRSLFEPVELAAMIPNENTYSEGIKLLSSDVAFFSPVPEGSIE